MLIRAYRVRGHLHANLDPLELAARGDHEELHPSHYGFADADCDRPIFLDNVLGLEFGTVREIVAILERTYCQTLGVEFMHIADPAEKAWIQERIEGPDKEIAFTPEGRRAILNKLVEAEGFEKFLDLKYTGTKRFGLDGGEAMIPALEQIIKRGGALGVKEIVLGMAHRGRLNVLAQVLGKPHRAIFHEFKGGSFTPDEVEGSGDVKYHLGTSSDRSFDGNNVHLSLTANPSHLEIVNPVVLGKVRAKQDQHADIVERTQGAAAPDPRRRRLRRPGRRGGVLRAVGPQGLPHRRHGALHHQQPDRLHHRPALLALLALSVRRGQDGRRRRSSTSTATTPRRSSSPPRSRPSSASSSTSRSSIDMFCYRRFGHNEGDEPAFTQPLMYQKIRAHPTTLEIYAKKLDGEGVVDRGRGRGDEGGLARQARRRSSTVAQSYKPNKADWLDGRWTGLKAVREDADDARRGETGIPARDPEGTRPAHHRGPGRVPGPSHDPALPRQPQAR